MFSDGTPRGDVMTQVSNNERERQSIPRHFGRVSHASLAARFGVSADMIRYVEKHALIKLVRGLQEDPVLMRLFADVCCAGDRRRHMNDDAWSDALSTIENAGEESYGQRAG